VTSALDITSQKIPLLLVKNIHCYGEETEKLDKKSTKEARGRQKVHTKLYWEV
jgi:hypothetical protein